MMVYTLEWTVVSRRWTLRRKWWVYTLEWSAPQSGLHPKVVYIPDWTVNGEKEQLL